MPLVQVTLDSVKERLYKLSRRKYYVPAVDGVKVCCLDVVDGVGGYYYPQVASAPDI